VIAVVPIVAIAVVVVLVVRMPLGLAVDDAPAVRAHAATTNARMRFLRTMGLLFLGAGLRSEQAGRGCAANVRKAVRRIVWRMRKG
jgi:hypothetical protein